MYRDLSPKHRRYSIVRLLVDRQVTDLVNQTFENIESRNIQTLADVRSAGDRLVALSKEMKREINSLNVFLNENMYHHPRMEAMARQARTIIETLFEKLKKDPSKLHGKFKLRVDKEPLVIIICDFIAGMTDRYAYRMYESLK
jgi:dGTPase